MLRIVLSTLIAATLVAALPGQPPAALTLTDLEHLALDRHPRMAQAELAVEDARGRAVQAGLYPNPVFIFYGDEIGDRTGPPGILSPFITQEILTAKKRPLGVAAAQREVDQACLAVATQRFALLVSVRQAYFDVLAVRARIDASEAATSQGQAALVSAGQLVKANKLTPYDQGLIEVEVLKYQSDLDAARHELGPALRRLAAVTGADLRGPVLGSLDVPLPDYEADRVGRAVLMVSPELQSARVGIEKARLLLARAQADAKPNVTIGAGYVRQSQNRSDDVSVQLGFPVPVFNRNQGKIRSAQAAYADAGQEVTRVELDLSDRTAAALRDYSGAKRKAELYRDRLLPRAKQVIELGRLARDAGEIDLLKGLEAYRALNDARQEYVKSQVDAWKAAATLSGLLLEEPWPAGLPVQPPAQPAGGRNGQ